jgi:imidazole glycerol-phosphate synthase subunit HisF
MLKTRVMPCLLLRDGALVKTVKFDKFKYIGDPINAVRIYNEKEVDELVFLDISATPQKRRPDFKLVSEIAGECFMPLAYGGGVRAVDDLRELFKIGVEKVIINSYAADNPEFISQAADLFGSQSIIASIDVKKNIIGKYCTYAHAGKKKLDFNPVEYAAKMQECGAGEILLTSIDKDGTWEGYDIDLIKQVSAAVSIPVIACGGAGRVDDFLRAVQEGGAQACAAGSMFVFQGKDLGVLIKYPTKQDLKILS